MAGPTPRGSIRCSLGWHAPARPLRWNDGFYFARCRRCRRDLVRTAFGRWEVPQGYRVVWRDKPPYDQSSAPGANNRSGASFWNVRDAPASWLDGDDFVPNEPAADRTDSRTRSRIPDFMDDAPPMPASAPARAPAGRRTSQPAAPARDDGRSPKNAPQAKARGTRLPFAVLFGFGIALSAAVVLTTGI